MRVTKLRLKPTSADRRGGPSLLDPRPHVRPRLSRGCMAFYRFVHIQAMQARLAIALAAVTAVAVGVAAQARSKWVYSGDDRRLHYGTDARGNRIMDFSHAGTIIRATGAPHRFLAKNWCIGCTGRPARVLWNGNPVAAPEMPSETFESPGVVVSPGSLYLAQLRDRLGPSALANIDHKEN